MGFGLVWRVFLLHGLFSLEDNECAKLFGVVNLYAVARFVGAEQCAWRGVRQAYRAFTK